MLRSGMGKWVTHCAMILGISVNAKVAFIMSAPKKIMNTMAVVSAVLSKAFFKPSALSSRLNRPASKVMAAPTAAPSVGENTPPYMPPNTTANTRAMGHTPPRAAHFSDPVVLAVAGARSGLKCTVKATTTM